MIFSSLNFYLLDFIWWTDEPMATVLSQNLESDETRLAMKPRDTHEWDNPKPEDLVREKRSSKSQKVPSMYRALNKSHKLTRSTTISSKSDSRLLNKLLKMKQRPRTHYRMWYGLQ